MSAGIAHRDVAPEWLDALDPSDPAARGSRRDLARLNTLMGQAGIAARLVRAHMPVIPSHIVDLGCGDGIAALRLLRRLGPAPEGSMVELVDTRPSVPDQVAQAIASLGWTARVRTADIVDWAGEDGKVDLVFANLVLHHFDAGGLAALMRAIARRSHLLVACEPARTRLSHAAARAVGAIGANAVTRHDAPASVRAGFRDLDLSTHWPGQVLFEGRRGPFTHAFAGAGLAS